MKVAMKSMWLKISNKCTRSTFIFVLLLNVLLLLEFDISNAQIVRVGAKVAAQVGWVGLDDNTFRDSVKTSPVNGFNIGGVASFKVKDRYFLHTEYVYSQKGKIIKGRIDSDLKDHATYRFFELPILYTMHFKGHPARYREFEWYIGAGPRIAYWLSGKGHITTGQIKENDLEKFDYTIKFGRRPQESNYNDFYYYHANRFQFGLNLGAGLLFKPGGNNIIMVDFRYVFDQTRFGKDNSDSITYPADFNDNLRVRNRAFQVSLMYLLEYNLDKKARHKGKSTLKSKRR